MLLTQEGQEKKILTIQRARILFTYIIALVCLTSLFSFEFINDYSDEFFIAKNLYQKEIDNVTESLAKIKKSAENTELYKNYTDAKARKNIAKKEYFKIKEEESVFGFKNKKIFLAELGPMICFFIYIIFMIYRSFYNDKNNIGILLLHATVLTGPIFYFYWIFQPFQDVSKFSYYFATFLTAVSSTIAVYFISKYQSNKVDKLNSYLMQVAKFTFKNTKPEKREEMLDMIKKIAKNK